MSRISFVALLAAAFLSFNAVAGRIESPLTTLAASPAQPAPVAKVAGGLVEVVEFYNLALQHYFISADPAEIAVLDGGAFGGAWKRTGNTFPAWDIVGSPAGTVPVCRFFGTDRYRPDGTRIGPNSHFYTADPAECEFVKTAFLALANDGRLYPAWTFESNAFAVKLPVGGACPAGTLPLYRAYNNGARGDPNHRYSQQASTLQAMAGWAFEGLVMCLPSSQGVTLPPQLGACDPSNCPGGSTVIGSGNGFINIVITITNPTTGPQELIIPPGQIFIATPATVQDGIALDRVQATIAAGTSRTFVLRLFCINAHRGTSATSTTYAPGGVTTNVALLDLVTVTTGKLAAAADPQGLKTLGTQYAVWEITDGRGSLAPAQRSLVAALLATAADDFVGQAGLVQQIFDSLSIVPPG